MHGVGRQRHHRLSIDAALILGLIAACAGLVHTRPPDAAPTSQDAGTPAVLSVVALLDAGRIDEADAAATRAFAVVANQGDPGQAAIDLVDARVANGRGADPALRALAERVVALRRSAAPDSPALAAALERSGDVRAAAGDWDAAATLVREALAIRERHGDAPESLAGSLDRLVAVLADALSGGAATYEEAVPLADRAVALRRPLGEPRLLARSLLARGLLRQAQGHYPAAREDLDEAAALLAAGRPDHPDAAVARMHRGEQYQLDGDLARAEDELTRACDTLGARLRAGHPALAACLRSRAVVHEETGDLVSARTLRERGLAIAQAALGAEHPKVAVQVNDLANNHLLQGEFGAARALYERARGIYAARLGPESNGALVAGYNLALLDMRLRDDLEAQRGLELTLTTWRRTLGEGHPNVARAYSALAELMVLRGRHADATRHYRRALSIRERVYGPSHPLVARTLSNMATALHGLGQRQAALAASNRALGIWETSGVQDGLAEALVLHAALLDRQEQRRDAAAALRRALDIREPLLGPGHPLVAEGHIALAAATAADGPRQDAFARALRGQRAAHAHALLTFGSLSERQALEYAATQPRGLDVALSLMRTPAEAREVLGEVVLARAQVQDEMSARRRAAGEAEASATRALRAEVRAARQRLATLVVKGPGERPTQHAALVDAARRAKESAERALAAESALFRASARRATIDLDAVRRALPDDVRLVSFVRYDRLPTVAPRSGGAGSTPSYVAFVSSRTTREPAVVDLGPAAPIDRAIGRWRAQVVADAATGASALPAAERRLARIGASVRRSLWDPLRAHVNGAARILVVPDGPVALLPLAALPAPDGGYLLEEGPAIHYLGAERDVVAASDPLDGRVRGLLALGEPAFASRASLGRTSPATPPAVAPAPPPALLVYRGTAPCTPLHQTRFAALPATGREVAEVARLWASAHPDATMHETSSTLVGALATEAAFKQRAPGHEVLHLATHAFFLGRECPPSGAGLRAVGAVVAPGPGSGAAGIAAARAPVQTGGTDSPLLLAGLALAGANARNGAGPDEEDGILTAEEVAGLDLSGVRWAVLSACDTGLGLVQAGEGVLGLRRAFHMAGVRTVIMSLWPVADRATERWMSALYRARLVEGRDTVESVREAARTQLQARRRAGQSGHPHFWAGFVAAGDWR